MNALAMNLADVPLESGMRWHPVCLVEDIPVLGSRVFDPAVCTGGLMTQRIAVFRNAQQQVFALDDRCPHKGGPLSQGIVFGDKVACPLHNWTLSLVSGEAAAPDVGCARSHAVRVSEGQVWLALRAKDGQSA